MSVLYEFINFMGFSMIEALSWVAITLTIFRFKFTEYWVSAVMICFFMNIISFFLRDVLDVGFVAPITNIVFIALMFFIFVRNVSVIWSFIISVSGLIVFVIIQSLVIASSFGLLSISEIDTSPERGYILQSITGCLVFAISYLLYKFGYGLTFEFNDLRFKWERLLILSVLVIMTTSFAILFYNKEVYINILFLLLALAFFIYFTFKKEAEAIDKQFGSMASSKN
jgi:hypothetical protein